MTNKLLITSLLLCFGALFLLATITLKPSDTDVYKSRDTEFKNKIGQIYADYMERYAFYSVMLLQQTPMWHEEKLSQTNFFEPELLVDGLDKEKTFLQTGYCVDDDTKDVDVLTWFKTSTSEGDFVITGLGHQGPLIIRLLVKNGVAVSDLALFKNGVLDYLTQAENADLPKHCDFSHLIPESSPVLHRKIKRDDVAINDNAVIFDEKPHHMSYNNGTNTLFEKYKNDAPALSRFSQVLDGVAGEHINSDAQEYMASCGGSKGTLKAEYNGYEGIITFPEWSGFAVFERRLQADQTKEKNAPFVAASENITYSEWQGVDLSCSREDNLYISCDTAFPEHKKYISLGDAGYRFKRHNVIKGWTDKEKMIPAHINVSDWIPQAEDSGCIWHDVMVVNNDCPAGKVGKILIKKQRYYVALSLEEGAWTPWQMMSKINNCK